MYAFSTRVWIFLMYFDLLNPNAAVKILHHGRFFCNFLLVKHKTCIFCQAFQCIFYVLKKLNITKILTRWISLATAFIFGDLEYVKNTCSDQKVVLSSFLHRFTKKVCLFDQSLTYFDLLNIKSVAKILHHVGVFRNFFRIFSITFANVFDVFFRVLEILIFTKILLCRKNLVIGSVFSDLNFIRKAHYGRKSMVFFSNLNYSFHNDV